MTPKEKGYAIWIIYLAFVILVSCFSIWAGNPEITTVLGVSVGLFGLGWFAAKLDAEHLKTKVAAPVTQGKKVMNDEEEWRSLLRKKEPWDP